MVKCDSDPVRIKKAAGDPIPAFASFPGSHFANVGIKGLSVNKGSRWSFGFDLGFSKSTSVL
jgi:hypothetical protein